MKRSILCLVTGGAGDARRLRTLTASLDAELTFYEVDKRRPRAQSGREIRALLRRRPWDLVIQEGTGIVGGGNLILAALGHGQRYVISSGDPVGGFFRTVHGRLWGTVFGAYERQLYRNSAGFVGWTPYLSGMALHLGAPRAATVEGGTDLDVFRPASREERCSARSRFGIPADALVCGMIGSLKWSARQRYCYGLELVEALRWVERDDVVVLIVGDGDGRAELERRVPPELSARVVFTGQVPPEDVAGALQAMDIGFITQTLDGLGSYRLTTKLPEYLAAGVPVAMSPIPGFYDYAAPAGWALPAEHPARERFHRELATWLDGVSSAEIDARRPVARRIAEERFDYSMLAQRFTLFIESVLSAGLADRTPAELV